MSLKLQTGFFSSFFLSFLLKNNNKSSTQTALPNAFVVAYKRVGSSYEQRPVSALIFVVAVVVVVVVFVVQKATLQLE